MARTSNQVQQEQIRATGFANLNYRVPPKIASRNLPLKTDHRQDVYFRLRDVVTIGLNILLGPPHPLENDLGQSRLVEGPKKRSTADNNRSAVSNDFGPSHAFA
jgi:hypothetical protein